MGTLTLWAATLLLVARFGGGARAQEPPVLLELSAAPDCARTIDGFGTAAPPKVSGEPWLQKLYFGDLGASILRVDLTPHFRSPASDRLYDSPWMHGQPGLPGPEGNNVRSYHDVADYGREWGGRRPPIVVFGPDVEQNLTRLDFASDLAGVGALARYGQQHARRGETMKLVGSLWSPAPWLKQSSGARFEGSGDVMPKTGTPWPFIWAGNFAGGRFDASDQPRKELDDGSGPTSALTQFTRIMAAQVLGFQRAFKVRFYAEISLQNELNFETFYNSCSYPDASDYVRTLKALRREFDRYAELRDVLFMGPEDLIDANAYALWQYGAPPHAVHKNLQYLAAVAGDPEAARALSFFAVHAYSPDGVHGNGDDSKMWRWWLEGWSSAPAAGLPENVRGTRAYGKKSWMTESSGEPNVWSPTGAAALSDSALGLAIKVHHALTAGEQSAWLYWLALDGKPATGQTLTNPSLRELSPKYVAYKHFARFVRPGACPLASSLSGAPAQLTDLYVSAYRHAREGTTLVLINAANVARKLELHGLSDPQRRQTRFELYVSTGDALWQKSSVPARGIVLTLALPARSIVTLRSQAARK